MPGIFEQRRKRIPDHRTAAMTDVHGAGRVRRDIFDIDPAPFPHGRAAIIAAFAMNQRKFVAPTVVGDPQVDRSEEHTSELQSLMRNSYAVFCLKKKKQN